MYRILIVEDDDVIAGVLERHLRQWGMEVCRPEEFDNITRDFARCQPQLVLMDISLPNYNGIYWCAEIRKLSSVPIIFLSSGSDNMNIIMAVNQRGDDFIAKPFDLNVLMAKIQALLRRAYSFQGTSSLLEHGGIVLNLGDASVSYQESRTELTKNEFKILQLLMERAGNIVTREEIMKRLWESDSFIDDNTLTVNMTRLRKKLESIGLSNVIATQKGLGYRFRD